MRELKNNKFKIQSELTQISIAYQLNERYFADLIFPPVKKDIETILLEAVERSLKETKNEL